MNTWMIFILYIILLVLTNNFAIQLVKENTIRKLCKNKTSEETKQILQQYTILEMNRNKK